MAEVDRGGPPEVFVSYTHADRAKVAQLASYIANLGFKVWLDTEDLVAGDRLIETIGGAIERAAAYVVCLSPTAVASQWVNHELNTALTLELATGSPHVLPVLIETTDLPSKLVTRLYIDATRSLDAAREPLRRALENIVGANTMLVLGPDQPDLWISSAQFRLFADTARNYGAPFGDHTAQQVREEALGLLTGLRRKANGILLNFIAAKELDWADPRFKFPNGEVSERIEDLPGPFDGSIIKRAVVDVEVINPREEQLAKLVSSQLEALGVLRVGYQFSIRPPDTDLPARVLQRLQDTYPILSWDPSVGAEVALPDDLHVMVRTSAEEIAIGLETKYPFQLERRAQQFSIREFVDWLRAP
ncbi:MAG TPA: toll/interleukin-1 receptor domain-containing protein [Frankiaceae bacterium]|jgi:hypothetical protein|nr:toll/interleukin-1 receptor domain-containing protein [Frankiaceae bacterium]